MKWHDGSAEGVIDIQSFEKEIKKPFSFFPDMPNTNQSTTFSHIFDGGYSAAYYSYHWAEVLSADAFEYFKENGLFSKEIAEKFRENILSKGNSEEPMELYKRFRGREPDPHALLRMKGLE
jgi:Zn-dependent oligopeptidase